MAEEAGIVMSFAGATAPEGWLLCDGSAVSRDTYTTLFAVIGTTYGVGDGSTTFNVPDLSGRVVIGVSGTHALASTGGATTVTLETANLPAHTHSVPKHGHANTIKATTPKFTHSITQPSFKYNKPNTSSNKPRAGSPSATAYKSTNTETASRATNCAITAHAAAACTKTGAITDCAAFNMDNAGGGGSHSNMQPYLAVAYIISTGE